MSRGRGGVRRGTRLASTLFAAFVLLALGASPASAHSELERSDPPDGGVAAVGRSVLTLWFTEAISAEASTFELRTSAGVRVATRTTVSEADDRGIVRITTEPLSKATYQLDWNVFASDDGHTTSGALVFGIGTRPATVTAAAGGLSGLPGSLLRWIDLSAIILAIGAVVVSGRVFGSMGEMGTTPRLRSLFIGSLAAGVAVASGVITPLFVTQRGESTLGEWFATTLAILIGTGWGNLWLARDVALVVAAAALFAATRSSRSIGWARIAAGALLAVVVLESWAGHASTLHSGTALAVFASATHLVAAGIWAGGLAVLAICLLPLMRRHPATRGRILGSAWRTFSPMAAIATVVLLATGLYEAGLQVPDLGAVASTVYGGTVAVKVALLGVALSLAGVNTLLVNPRLALRVGRLLGQPAGWVPLPTRHFVKVVAAEVLVLVVAVGAAGVLTSVPTSRDLAAATRQTELHSAAVDGLFVTLEQVAAGPNRSRLIVRARSVVKLEQTPITGVSATLVESTGRRDVRFERIEPGRYEAETSQLTPGTWTASVTLHRDGLPVAVARFEGTVVAEGSESVGALEIVTTVLAVLLLAVLLGSLLFIRRRSRAAVGKPLPLPSAEHEREKVGSRR
jgi:copper transport protein